jgi:hypothetical protein
MQPEQFQQRWFQLRVPDVLLKPCHGTVGLGRDLLNF